MHTIVRADEQCPWLFSSCGLGESVAVTGDLKLASEDVDTCTQSGKFHPRAARKNNCFYFSRLENRSCFALRLRKMSRP